MLSKKCTVYQKLWKAKGIIRGRFNSCILCETEVKAIQTLLNTEAQKCTSANTWGGCWLIRRLTEDWGRAINHYYSEHFLPINVVGLVGAGLWLCDEQVEFLLSAVVCQHYWTHSVSWKTCVPSNTLVLLGAMTSNRRGSVHPLSTSGTG